MTVCLIGLTWEWIFFLTPLHPPPKKEQRKRSDTLGGGGVGTHAHHICSGCHEHLYTLHCIWTRQLKISAKHNFKDRDICVSLRFEVPILSCFRLGQLKKWLRCTAQLSIALKKMTLWMKKLFLCATKKFVVLCKCTTFSLQDFLLLLLVQMESWVF